MIFKLLRNNKGMNLLGTMIAAAVGLILASGISKSLVNFADQTASLARRGDINIIKQNLVAKLKDTVIWKATKERLGCIPGKDCDISLFDVDQSGNATNVRWVCRRKGGTNRQGIVVMAQNGLTQPLNCSTCASDISCGYDPKKFIRAEIESTPNALNDISRPSYGGFILDTVRSKKMINLDVLSSSEELTDEQQVTCPNGSFLVRVEDGKPICEKNNVALVNKGCLTSQFLVGFDKNGNPVCRDNDQGIKNKRCPTGTIVTGFNLTGDPICQSNVKPKLGQYCPQGYYLRGYNNNGDPVCSNVRVKVNCRLVQARGVAPTYFATARCSAGETNIQGGGRCLDKYGGLSAGVGFLHHILSNSEKTVVDCYGRNGTEDAPAVAWALCCK